MEVYRISQEIYSGDLSGNGAKLYGGRWNSPGTPVVYAASSRALALIETLAHTPAKMLQIKTYILSTLYIPDDTPHDVIQYSTLPKGWDEIRKNDFTTRTGNAFVQRGEHLYLEVPSVLMPEESIFMINPLHPVMKDIRQLKSRPVRFDSRISVV